MKKLLIRATNILLRPRREWEVIKSEETSYRVVLFRYVAVLALIPPVAAVAGRLFLDRGITTAALGSSLIYVVATNGVWYCMYLLDVVIAGAILTLFINSPGSRLDFVQGLKLSAYSFTPLCIAGLLAGVPLLGWVLEAAILYSVYLLFLGIVCVAGVVKKRAAWYAIGSFLCAALVLAVINVAEYFAESLIMHRISG